MHEDLVYRIIGKGTLDRYEHRAINTDAYLLRNQTERHEATMPNAEAFAQAVADQFMSKDITGTVYQCSHLFCVNGVPERRINGRSTQAMVHRLGGDLGRFTDPATASKPVVLNGSNGPFQHLMTLISGINTRACYFRAVGDRQTILANLRHGATFGSQANKGAFLITKIEIIKPVVDLEMGLFAKLDDGRFEPVRTVPVEIVPPQIAKTLNIVWDRFRPPYYAGERVKCVGPSSWVMSEAQIAQILGFEE